MDFDRQQGSGAAPGTGATAGTCGNYQPSSGGRRHGQFEVPQPAMFADKLIHQDDLSAEQSTDIHSMVQVGQMWLNVWRIRLINCCRLAWSPGI